ncbi:hypothetical protein AHAS_Ahas01G0154200 [Arachis hypogaea]
MGLVCHTPSLALVSRVGVPRLDVQVARQSGIIELACHAIDTQVARPALFGLLKCWRATPDHASGAPNVPRHVAQVARPFNFGSLRLGVPHLDPQVARPSKFWNWPAMPLIQSGTP